MNLFNNLQGYAFFMYFCSIKSRGSQIPLNNTLERVFYEKKSILFIFYLFDL